MAVGKSQKMITYGKGNKIMCNIEQLKRCQTLYMHTGTNLNRFIVQMHCTNAWDPRLLPLSPQG